MNLSCVEDIALRDYFLVTHSGVGSESVRCEECGCAPAKSFGGGLSRGKTAGNEFATAH